MAGFKIQRRFIPVVESEKDRGIRVQYAIDQAAWMWHPDFALDQTAIVRFTLELDLAQALSTTVHLSADQRFEWSINGQYVGMGPDRCDLDHWSFHSYDLSLEPGVYRIEATVWWLKQRKPVAQMTRQGGFVFAAAPEFAEQFNTGSASWQVCSIENISFQLDRQYHGYHVIGPESHVDGRVVPCGQAIEPVVVKTAMQSSTSGLVREGWRSYPTSLPDMMARPCRFGTVQAAGEVDAGTIQPSLREDPPVAAEAMNHGSLSTWQRLLDGTSAMRVEPGRECWAVVRLDDYLCGYTQAELEGDGSLRVEWTESLFTPRQDDSIAMFDKGDRAAVEGKTFMGFGDTFFAGGHQRTFKSHWWRCGQFVRLVATAGDQALTVRRADMIETRYPVENETTWISSDEALNDITSLAVRGMQMCMHETFFDCPFYEQMMYVGDTRVEMLINHVLSGDDRLVRRGIELFDWSRWRTGMVAERYPSQPMQMSPTFSMIWTLMVRDYALWRDDPTWVQQRMLGVRAMIDQMLSLRDADGFLAKLPGWSFVDWVRPDRDDPSIHQTSWQTGYPPSAYEGGVSSVVNLHLMLTLRAAAELEQWHGDALLAERWTKLADELAAKLTERFWSQELGLLLDDDRGELSEHAQCLALLSDTLPAELRPRCFQSLITNPKLQRTTVYFSFYLLETMYHFGRGDLVVEQLDFWKDLKSQGFKTPVESPEPSRSDCHAWGSHPLYHMHASLCGIRPTSPGFKTVEVRPQPGPLQSIKSSVPHPSGRIELSIEPAEAGKSKIAVTLPDGVTGQLVGRDQTLELKAGGRVEAMLVV